MGVCVQGTACIYSRKVEYLHSLVFQVLDRLTQQHTNATAKDSGKNTNSNNKVKHTPLFHRSLEGRHKGCGLGR